MSAQARQPLCGSLRLLVLPLAMLVGPGCERSVSTVAVPADADPQRGARLFHSAGCDSCHWLPSHPGRMANVGPPLMRMSERGYIGGVLANDFDNMVRWLRAPRQVDPLTAMPDTGLSEAQARDVAAYLYRPQ